MLHSACLHSLLLCTRLRKKSSLLVVACVCSHLLALPRVLAVSQKLGDSWESGKARYRNTLVALEPILELKMVGQAAERATR